MQKITTDELQMLIGFLGLFLLAGFVGTVKQPKRLIGFNCFWVIMTTGYAAMAVEIVLIFMLQNPYGYYI